MLDAMGFDPLLAVAAGLGVVATARRGRQTRAASKPAPTPRVPKTPGSSQDSGRRGETM